VEEGANEASEVQQKGSEELKVFSEVQQKGSEELKGANINTSA
jgi:hypothetical protein